MRPIERLAFLCVVVGTMPLGMAVAKPLPGYTYGEMWWDEYPSDKGTDLLLHFGPPTVTAQATLGAAVKAKKADETLVEDVVAQAGKALPREDLELATVDTLGTLPPVDETRLAAGMAADYGDRRRILELGEGCRIVPEGRFGAGLSTDGAGALAVRIGPPQSAECWFRADKLPDREACLLSLGGDEARLLLRPDGHLELRLKKPHGNPNREKLSPEAIKTVEAREAGIVAPDAVVLGIWTHVAAVSVPHPAPGNTGSWEAALRINGTQVASYMSEGGNQYEPLGLRNAPFVIGNSTAGGAGFKGLLDEVRVSTVDRSFYERPALPWRDAAGSRPLQFDRPWFRSDSTAVHASFDKGLSCDRPAANIVLDLKGQPLAGLLVDGIRGKACIMDPEIGFARVPLTGMTCKEGALEFWLRPVNWDDCTGYWQHSPPLRKDLSVARLMTADGKPAFSVTLPRAYNLERQRVPIDPGHWSHVMLVWDEGGWAAFVDGKVLTGARREKGTDLAKGLAYVELGVSDEVAVIRGQRPRIEVDEVVGYRAHLRADEVEQARQRWIGVLKPIPLFDARFEYKWSIHKLDFTLVPLLPEGQTAGSLSVALHEAASGKLVVGPVEMASLTDQKFHAVLSEGRDLPYGSYQFQFQIRDTAGKTVVEGTRDWDHKEEPWRFCKAGILDKVPAPWTPIRVEAVSEVDRAVPARSDAAGTAASTKREKGPHHLLSTRMTAYTLGTDGLPKGIMADGEEILAAPFGFLEAGKPMPGRIVTPVTGPETEKTWSAEFTGDSCDILMQCRLEYDGMIRYELGLKPKGRVAPIAFVMPVKREHATRWLAYPMGERGPRTGVVDDRKGLVLTSRADPAPYAVWRQFVEAQKKDKALTWEQYWQPVRDRTAAYGFYGHVDLNDMNRGLWWFCDNAAGWVQSKTNGAVEIVRTGDAVSLVLNLVAEAGDWSFAKPIVFGILPHPARPMPDKYRLFQRVPPEVDPVACDVFDAFYPWPMDPRSHSMKLYPAPDPKRPADGPSWDYAERCVPIMKACKARGTRTMYLSKAYFSCRAGAYDNWEWRSGEGSTVSLTPSFVNYLCWEMDEWIKRGIWDGIYLDECYEHPARNLEAGFSVRLPDGTEQPGVSNFQFRELMKRWRNLFTAYGREPLLLSHLTYSWQYQGVVFCDAYLDGENRPIVSLNSADWVDSTSKPQFEVIQNGRLWGVASFYMPFIAEGGFDNKDKSQFPVWQWRMARQVQSQFAHYETATVYEGQGSRVYKAYWASVLNWGSGDPRKATFHPYWDNAKFVQVADQGGDVLVSFYRQPGKVLLIASNRAKEQRTLHITLDAGTLGLPSGFKVRDVDGTLKPPTGSDFVPGADKAAAASALDDSIGTGLNDKQLALQDVDTLLTSPTQKQAAEEQALAPRVEAGVLVLPVRGRDFRQVELE
jgi:hypothetical protein